MYREFNASSSCAEGYDAHLRAPLPLVNLHDFSDLVKSSIGANMCVLLSAVRMILSLDPQRDSENGAHDWSRLFICCTSLFLLDADEVLCDDHWRIGDLHSITMTGLIIDFLAHCVPIHMFQHTTLFHQ